AAARSEASAREKGNEASRDRKGRIFAVSGIGPPKVVQLKTTREIVSNVRGFTIQNRPEPIVGVSGTRPDDVLLVLARELAARNEQVGTVFSDGSTRPVAEATEPNEEIFLELGRFLLAQLVVRDESDVDESERLLEDGLNFFFEHVLRRRSRVKVV
ncbi:MAG TPA: hypothetical protein VN032_01830, partial [Thermoanaerobaculia bacterium]|nr:hypothetical protein [Thermoanaerobaculia bacterium]